MCFDGKGELVKLGNSYDEDYFLFDTKKNYKQILKTEKSFPEEILDALIYGVKEYCGKLGFKKLLVGLSGGIDSAIVAYIGAKALGSENLQVLLMPSKYSSKGSVDDAKKLIDNLGIKWENVSIQPVFDSIKKTLAPALGEDPKSVTEENIQARIRGVYLMAVSNNYNSLLLTTGNKSELAVGYCTLYGDMAGGLAVIADLYKTEVYELAKYINKQKEIIPQEIITKPPSAELKVGQKDQDTLPPYEFLDEVLQMYLEENKEEREIVKLVGKKEIVKKILRMVDLNEFKRKQAAPALRVSRKAFGYGRRYPIVQGWRR